MQEGQAVELTDRSFTEEELTAQFIEEYCSELVRMAEELNRPILAYFLRTARLEAAQSASSKPRVTDSAASLDYIEEICAELRTLAGKSKMQLLAYFLEMARQEAAENNAGIKECKNLMDEYECRPSLSDESLFSENAER